MNTIYRYVEVETNVLSKLLSNCKIPISGAVGLSYKILNKLNANLLSLALTLKKTDRQRGLNR